MGTEKFSFAFALFIVIYFQLYIEREMKDGELKKARKAQNERLGNLYLVICLRNGENDKFFCRVTLKKGRSSR